jgi:uncharacterized protein
MSFSHEQSKRFAAVFDRSDFHAQEPIVKIQSVSKGSNVAFGRTLKAGEHENLIYIGKVLETSVGKSYLNWDAWLDVSFPHVIYITGTRGSGKSFDLGVLLEGVSALSQPSPIQNEVGSSASILIDTQSQFWTLRYPPNKKVKENARQLEELGRWNIAPNSLSNCDLYLPVNSSAFTGDEKRFAIRPSLVRHEEWCALIKEDVYSPQGHIVARTIDALEDSNYSIDDMIAYIATPANWPNVADASRNAVRYKLEDFNRTGLFDRDGLDVKSLLRAGKTSVFLLRDIRNEDKSLLTGILARQLFTIMGEHHRKRKLDAFFGKSAADKEIPSRVWLFIDEAHVVAPNDAPSPAREALVEYVKRGRDAGLSLVLATQQPSAVDDRILSQVNISFSHRLTFQNDIAAATGRIPTKLLGSLKLQGVELTDFGDMLRHLDSGQCFVGDHSSSRAILVQIRPRITSHGGYSPA